MNIQLTMRKSLCALFAIFSSIAISAQNVQDVQDVQESWYDHNKENLLNLVSGVKNIFGNKDGFWEGYSKQSKNINQSANNLLKINALFVNDSLRAGFSALSEVEKFSKLIDSIKETKRNIINIIPAHVFKTMFNICKSFYKENISVDVREYISNVVQITIAILSLYLLTKLSFLVSISVEIFHIAVYFTMVGLLLLGLVSAATRQ